MSSDWNEPGATWPSTPNANWTQSPDLIPPQHVEGDYPLHAQQETDALAAQNIHDPSFSPEPDVFPDNQETDEGEESDTAAGLDAANFSDSLLKQLWRYATLIIFPLLFFGIACLLIVPSFANSHPSLPSVSLWFIAIALAIIAVAQGIAVYFAGPRHNMWIPGTVGGLTVFVLFAVFATAGPIPGAVLLLAILGGSIYLARRCIHPVVEGTVDVVYAAGQYSRTLFPGLNLIWPWEEVTHQVNIEEANLMCPLQKIQLSPEEDVILRAVISYQVVPEDAHLTVTQLTDWKESLLELLAATLQTVATHFVPTDFLAWPQSLQAYQAQTPYHDPQSVHAPDEERDDFSAGPARREHINTLLLEQMRDRVAIWGIQIHWSRIRDIDLAPHTMAGISTPPMVLDYTTNDDQAEKELVAASSATSQIGNDSIGEKNASISVDQEPTEAIQVAVNTTPSQILPPIKLPSEETLRKAYEQVQSGRVRDPQTIRQIAVTFKAVARDPALSQKISFDAERASENLYKQAQHYEELYQSDEVYADITQADVHMS